MADGTFMDEVSTSFTALYGAGKPRDCFQLNPDQNVGGCTSQAAVFCEITLFKDTHICLNKEFMSGVTLNASTALTVPSSVSFYITVIDGTVQFVNSITGYFFEHVHGIL